MLRVEKSMKFMTIYAGSYAIIHRSYYDLSCTLTVLIIKSMTFKTIAISTRSILLLYLGDAHCLENSSKLQISHLADLQALHL